MDAAHQVHVVAEDPEHLSHVEDAPLELPLRDVLEVRVDGEFEGGFGGDPEFRATAAKVAREGRDDGDRAAVAGQAVQVPTVAEIDGMRDGYATNRMNSFHQEFSKNWEKWAQEDHADRERKDTTAEQEQMWTRMQYQDSARKVVQQEIDQYAARLDESLRQKKKVQMKLALSLARFSPSANYQLATMTLAGNDIPVKDRYEESINGYRSHVLELRDKKLEEAGPGGGGGIMVMIDSEKGIQVSAPKAKSLDLSDFPLFVKPSVSVGDAFGTAVVDFSILLLWFVLAFGGAFAAFLKYDVR